MIDFMVPPQIVVGEAGHVVDVEMIDEGRPGLVKMRLLRRQKPIDGGDRLLAEDPAVPAVEKHVMSWLAYYGAEAAKQLDDADWRKRRLRGF